MQLHQLRYFVAVAETLSFRKGADRCFVSQPSLSQQIIKLEEELGHRLFERLGRRIQLTSAGEALLPKARAVLQSLGEIQQHVDEAIAEGRGAVSVGAIPTMAPYLLPPAVEEFASAYPEAQVTLHEALTEDLLQRVVNGQVDLAFMSLPIAQDSLQAQLLWEEPLLVCLSAGSPLAEEDRIRAAQLAGEPAIVLDSLHCLGRQIQGFCDQRRLMQTIACYSCQLSTVQQMIAQGLGYSFIPQMCAEQDQAGRIVYRPLAGTPPKRAVAAVWRKSRTLPRLAQAFLEIVSSASRQ